MRERLRQFEGDMKIEPGDRGTKILFTIPIAESGALKPEAISEELQAS